MRIRRIDLKSVADWLPIKGRINALRRRQGYPVPGHPQEHGLVGGGEVAAMAGFEADDGVAVIGELDGPPSGAGGAIAVLDHVLVVVVGLEVLFMVALQPHRLRVLEQLHC